MILTKIKKINKRTCKNKIIHSTPVFVFTYYFGHISYYLCIFLLCSCSIYPWYRLKYTKFRNGGLVRGFAITSDGCFYFFCFFTFIPVPLSTLSLSFISSTISSVSFLPFSGRWHKMTHKGWCVIKPQHNQKQVWTESILGLRRFNPLETLTQSLMKMLTDRWIDQRHDKNYKPLCYTLYGGGGWMGIK